MNLREPKTQKILAGCLALVVGGYIYFGTSLFPFNYPVRKAKIEELKAEHEKLSAEVEKARKVVGDRQAATPSTLMNTSACMTSGSRPRNFCRKRARCRICCAR